MDRNEIRSMYGIKDDALLDRTLKTYHEIDVPRLLSMAADGSNAIVEMAKGLVDDAMATHGAAARTKARMFFIMIMRLRF